MSVGGGRGGPKQWRDAAVLEVDISIGAYGQGQCPPWTCPSVGGTSPGHETVSAVGLADTYQVLGESALSLIGLRD